MAGKKISLQLSFDENLKKNANLPTTKRLAFDDLGEFIDERTKIQRLLETRNNTELKVDYTDFENHVFFDSATEKLGIGIDRVLTKYPFNGTEEERDAFFLTGSGYEQYLFDSWPREVAYVEFDGINQHITASDVESKLYLGSSSLNVSAWTHPEISHQNVIFQYMSASTSPVLRQGYEMYFSGATDPHLKFSIHSGTEVSHVSASYAQYTGSFNNVSAIYSEDSDILSLHVNGVRVASSSAVLGPIDIGFTNLAIGSGSQFTTVSSSYEFYSGSINDLRVMHTSSEAFYNKRFNQPISAEDYVKLNYKFNEGIIGSGSIDSFIVDYSQSGLHGRYLNYTVDSSRTSGSVMQDDPGDPILYSFSDRVVSFTGSHAVSASLHDLDNNNSIFNMIPEGVLREDDAAEGLLRSFSLAMARFFDDIKLYMDQFVNLRTTNYDGIDETPDLFLPHLQRYFGWKVTEHFSEADPMEFLLGKNILSTGSLQTTLSDVRHQFWRRTLNNLPLLMKSKGTRKNIDYLMNVFGLNKDNIKIKEFGYLPGTSIQDERIEKEKVQYRVGIGTGSLGSLSSSFFTVSSASLYDTSDPTVPYTIESTVQFPFSSASYSGSILSGGIWQMDVTSDLTHSLSAVRCHWVRDSLTSDSGQIILEASSSTTAREYLTSSNINLFQSDFIHVAAGLNSSQFPFISVRKLDNGELTINQDVTGSEAFAVTASSNHNLYMGANTSSVFFADRHDTQGYFGEVRYWDKKLSGSELDDHAFNFQSVGTKDPFGADANLLRGHWALNENLSSSAAGIVSSSIDLSRNNRHAVGLQFNASESPYKKFSHKFNYLSPTVDLKWTENKIRVRNVSQLKREDVAFDSNEVSLEFNLIDSLNEDIVKIFSTLDSFNNLIGQPVFKYRDEYSDLEGVRREYFRRLGDQLNFTQFFGLFKWFDKKISDAIKQILPARTRFIGGEQVIESHLLERPKYRYHYPIFKSPQEPPEVELTNFYAFDASQMKMHSGEIDPMATMSGAIFTSPQTTFSDGAERVDRIPGGFYRIKVNGDNSTEINDAGTGINFKNEFAKRSLEAFELTSSQVGNLFVMNPIDAAKNQEHYFGGANKYVRYSVRCLSGSNSVSFGDLTIEANTSSVVPATEFLELTGVLYDANDSRINTASFLEQVTGAKPEDLGVKISPELTLKISSSAGSVTAYPEMVQYRDATADSFVRIFDKGAILETEKDIDGYQLIRWKFQGVDDPEIALTNQVRHVMISSSTDDDHAFKDVRFDFEQPLSDDGVKKYEDYDNEHSEKISSFINDNVMPDIED